MNLFRYERAASADDAVRALAAEDGAKLLGGGTNLVDLMKQRVERPAVLVDVSRVGGLNEITAADDGGLRIGAGVRNSDLANHAEVRARYPLLSQAVLAGASAQLRNLATTGGNLMQRTRCYYFYDPALGGGCNKREPGSGCAAVEGWNRIHAILGQTDDGPASGRTCIATNPSDMSVALAALDARVEIVGPEGVRVVPVREFHRLVGDTPELDTNLKRDEMITAVLLPSAAARFATASWYLKARDRQSYAFALVSVAAGLEIEGGVIQSAALAMGGVAHKPWVRAETEAALVGKPAGELTYAVAAELMLEGARGYRHNAFKVELARRGVVQALRMAGRRAR